MFEQARPFMDLDFAVKNGGYSMKPAALRKLINRGGDSEDAAVVAFEGTGDDDGGDAKSRATDKEAAEAAKAFLLSLSEMETLEEATNAICKETGVVVSIKRGAVHKSTKKGAQCKSMGFIPRESEGKLTITTNLHVSSVNAYKAYVTYKGQVLFYVTESSLPNAGLGLFAGMDFDEGEVVGTYCGEEMEEEDSDCFNQFAWRYGDQYVVPKDAESFLMMHYANDPCYRPNGNEGLYNISVDDEMVVRATKPIARDDELFVKYNMTPAERNESVRNLDGLAAVAAVAAAAPEPPLGVAQLPPDELAAMQAQHDEHRQTAEKLDLPQV